MTLIKYHEDEIELMTTIDEAEVHFFWCKKRKKLLLISISTVIGCLLIASAVLITHMQKETPRPEMKVPVASPLQGLIENATQESPTESTSLGFTEISQLLETTPEIMATSQLHSTTTQPATTLSSTFSTSEGTTRTQENSFIAEISTTKPRNNVPSTTARVPETEYKAEHTLNATTELETASVPTTPESEDVPPQKTFGGPTQRDCSGIVEFGACNNYNERKPVFYKNGYCIDKNAIPDHCLVTRNRFKTRDECTHKCVFTGLPDPVCLTEARLLTCLKEPDHYYYYRPFQDRCEKWNRVNCTEGKNFFENREECVRTCVGKHYLFRPDVCFDDNRIPSPCPRQDSSFKFFYNRWRKTCVSVRDFCVINRNAFGNRDHCHTVCKLRTLPESVLQGKNSF